MLKKLIAFALAAAVGLVPVAALADQVVVVHHDHHWHHWHHWHHHHHDVVVVHHD